MDKDKLLRIVSEKKSSTQVDKYYGCIKMIVKRDIQYYYNKDYIIRFINK